MRTVSIFKNGKNQAIRLPRDMEFDGVNELEIYREGDAIILRPVKPDWISLKGEGRANKDFLADRPAVVEDEGRVQL